MNTRCHLRIISLVLTLFLAFTSLDVAAQSAKANIKGQYKRLNSLKESMADARNNPPPDGFLAIPNKPWRPIGGAFKLDDPEIVSKGSAAMQDFVANGPLTPGVSFQALHHKDNWTPADPSGDVGPNHIVLAVNSNLTVFNKDGSIATGGSTVRADAIWNGTSCYGGSNGDPIILYDEASDRWIAALTHFSLNLLCIAASATSDPLGAWHDYVFDFGSELPDYPKLGLTPDHLVVTAHMFGASFNGTLFGTINKAALYAGASIDLLYATGYTYGYLPVDMDGPMASRNPLFVGFASSSTAYVYEMTNINYSTQSLNVQFVNSISFASVDRSVCSATRGQCIVQPATWKVESLDGRLMNRAQLRDYGSYSAMVFSQTINAGSERAGIAWYEIRSSGGNWSKWQEGQYAPNDGKHRWMPSIALNAAGDIGMSFMFAGPADFASVAVVGQSATERASATGQFDGNEMVCTNGSTALDPTGYKRSGDYSATVVDPVSDTFWGMQQYGFPGNWANWGIWICEFGVTPSSNTNPPVAGFSGSPQSGVIPFDVAFVDQSTNSPTSWSWSFGDGGSSTLKNPVHTYAAAGTFTVTLTATNTYGSDDETKVDYVSATAPIPPPADPTNLLATGTSTSEIHVEWTDNATDEDGYKLERSDDGSSGWSEVASLGAGVNSYDDGSLPSGATYYYRSYAYRGTTNSGFSNVDSAQTASPPAIDHVASSESVVYGSLSGNYTNTHTNGGGPEVITESESGGKPANRTSRMEVVYTIPIRSDVQATFFANTWSSVSTDFDVFEFWFSENGSNYTKMFEVSGGSDDDSYRSFVLGSPSSSTIWIKVNDSDRGRSNRSLDALSIDHMFVRTETSPDPPPAKPTLTASAGGSSTANLSWTDVATETGYRVQRKTGGAAFATVKNLAADETSWVDTGLSGSTSYDYQVGAFNGGGTTYSDPKTIVTSAPEEVHVGSLVGSASSGGKWTATVTILVHDGAHSPSAGALVSGNWGDGGSGSDSCTTNGSGTCQVSKSFKRNTSSVSFAVSNIVKSGYVYQSANNHDTSVIVSGAAGKGDLAGVEIPETLSLDQNYPNPFNPVTIIQYGVPETGHVTVSVFNALGVEVAHLEDGVEEAGWHRTAFDASQLSSGVYVAVIRFEGQIRTRTMLLAK